MPNLTETYVVGTRVQKFEDLSNMMLAVDRECKDCYDSFHIELGGTIGYCDYVVSGVGIESYEKAFRIYKAFLKCDYGNRRHRHIFRKL